MPKHACWKEKNCAANVFCWVWFSDLAFLSPVMVKKKFLRCRHIEDWHSSAKKYLQRWNWTMLSCNGVGGGGFTDTNPKLKLYSSTCIFGCLIFTKPFWIPFSDYISKPLLNCWNSSAPNISFMESSLWKYFYLELVKFWYYNGKSRKLI